jgi:hypothetical protein
VDNPFERFDLDPHEGIAAITQRLKELAEDAKDDAERERIRAAWEELTLHPRRRLRAALFAHPETRRPLGGPPPLPRVVVSPTELGLREIAARPSVLGALRDAAKPVDGEALSAPALDRDPILTSRASRR